MVDTRQRLRAAAQRAPEAGFSIDDVFRRRDHAQRRRRVSAALVGVGLTLSLAAIGLGVVGPLAGSESGQTPRGGAGLPPAAREPVVIDPNDYSYQHIAYAGECAPRDCLDLALVLESWWRSDNSGRIDVVSQQNYGIQHGMFGPGKFPAEGALRAFPLDPDELKAFLLQRSGPDGSSPRPVATPSPGVSLEEGLLWNSIRDYLGTTQYLNTTPQLRAAMLEVLASLPMVRVDLEARDPVGRDAIALRFVAYAEDIVVYVDPATHDFLAMTGLYLEGGSTETIVVRAAGAVTAEGDLPTGADRSIPTAP